MKILLLSEHAIRLELSEDALAIEASAPEVSYSPFHMVASGLASCTVSVLYGWATHAGLSVDDLAVEVSWTFAEAPTRMDTIRVVLHWPSLPESRRGAAVRAAELCAVHATLSHPPRIDLELAA